ncbi:MAG: ATP-dependent DNA helicase RecG [Gammaproteobacteria bacterium]|nr:MAG: ATP-dependent DNA helicase RecG [Gammaproteobacteria bacterium]
MHQLSLTQLSGVGGKVVEKLLKLGISSINDLLLHLPFRYEDRTRLTPISTLREGDKALIEGKIESCEVLIRKRRRLVCQIRDESGTISINFFHFYPSQQKTLLPGKRIQCFGEVTQNGWLPSMVHPEYRILRENEVSTVPDTLTPIYPTAQGLGQSQVQKLVQQAINISKRNIEITQDLLPEQIMQRKNFPQLSKSLAFIHAPPPDAPIEMLEEREHIAFKRMAYEELLAHNIAMREYRSRMLKQDDSYAVEFNQQIKQQFLQNLGFNLTGAQNRVLQEIYTDLATPTPMLRLVQGDVGSGKTVVAALSVLQCVASGYQVVIMAPTELLAEQHLKNFSNWFEPLGLEVAWLSGKVKGKARENVLRAIESGTTQVIVGTHAVFQEDVHYQNLALTIIDEQHRFGVHQRMALKEKGMKGGKAERGRKPHQLIMTATPIPRTLAMVAYADLDTSVIDELPPGRKPIKTVVIPEQRRTEVIERIRDACKNGSQVYWVCPLIDESEKIECEAAAETKEILSAQLSELRVGLVHGRLKAQEKEEIMQQFMQGRVDLLVATTVIEVGVDVPNASLMIIENSERLGLSQLHQLRGRVGRGSKDSSCVLLYKGPLSQMAKSRLQTVRESNDGFYIAQKDLELRGPGEVLGTRQTGTIGFLVADLARDEELLDEMQQVGDEILRDYPELVEPLKQRWIGDSSRYGEV